MVATSGVGSVVVPVKGDGLEWTHTAELIGDPENDLNAIDKKPLGNSICLHCL